MDISRTDRKDALMCNYARNPTPKRPQQFGSMLLNHQLLDHETFFEVFTNQLLLHYVPLSQKEGLWDVKRSLANECLQLKYLRNSHRYFGRSIYRYLFFVWKVLQKFKTLNYVMTFSKTKQSLRTCVLTQDNVSSRPCVFFLQNTVFFDISRHWATGLPVIIHICTADVYVTLVQLPAISAFIQVSAVSRSGLLWEREDRVQP